jgi:hypothetical protein
MLGFYSLLIRITKAVFVVKLIFITTGYRTQSYYLGLWIGAVYTSIDGFDNWILSSHGVAGNVYIAKNLKNPIHPVDPVRK